MGNKKCLHCKIENTRKRFGPFCSQKCLAENFMESQIRCGIIEKILKLPICKKCGVKHEPNEKCYKSKKH